MTQYVLQVFEDEDQLKFRVIDRDGEPWFVLGDICKRLDIKNVSDAASRLDDDEKMTVAFAEGHSGTRGGPRSVLLVNESGLYSLISHKSVATDKKRTLVGTIQPGG